LSDFLIDYLLGDWGQGSNFGLSDRLKVSGFGGCKRVSSKVVCPGWVVRIERVVVLVCNDGGDDVSFSMDYLDSNV
jgi:hypothetical protein